MKTINSFRSKLFALTLALVASVSSFAYDEMPDFQVDGLYYNFLEGDNVEVTHPYIPVVPVENVASNTKKKSHAISADDYYNLTNIVIPSTVTYEGKVYNVTRIGFDAFNQCDKLTFVDIPSSVKTIGVGAFYFCSSLTSITLKEGLEHIEWNAFEDCRSLENITFPNSLKTIGNYAFSNTLWYKNHPNGAVYAGNVFYKYKGDIPQNTSFVIKEGTVSISPYAFVKENYHEDYSLVSVSIPNSVEVIGEGAFYRCRALTSIVIPAGVTTIETLAFHYCKALKSVTCEAVNPPALSGSVFLSTPIADATLYVPAESIEAYQTATEWKDFGQILPITWSEECYEYRNYNLTIQLFPRKSSLVYTLYHTDDRTIEPPYVDSVWILDPELDKQNPLHVHTLYAQPGDTIDLSLLEKNKYYILRVHINECQMSRVFLHRVVKWEYKWCNQWNVLWFDGMRFDEIASTSHYQLGQDTIIGDYTYRKFTSRTSVRFTEDWKVYVYYEGFDDNDPYTEDLPTGEYLAYDFSAQVGDTLEVFSGISTYSTYLCVVDDVQQTDIQTALRTITLHKICRMDTDGDGIEEEYGCGEMTWIEGVGSPNGFLINTPLPGGGTYALLCAYKDDELKYTGSYYERFGCDYNAGVISDDLFPTLSGLQRTICREYYEQADNKTRMEQFTNLTTRTETGGPYIYCSPFLLREKDNKILIYSRSLNKDLVLYDFNLQVGNSLPMLYIDFFAKDDWIADSDMEIWCIVDYHKDLEGNLLPADTLIVTDVSAITLLDGKEYKKWTFNNGMEYVEGIGSFGNRQWSGDFFQLIANRDVPTSLQGERLVCASRNGQLLYKMDDAEMEQLETECLCEIESKWSETWCNQWNILSHGYQGPQDPLVAARTSIFWLSNNTVNRDGQEYIPLMCSSSKPDVESTNLIGELRFTEDKQVYFYYDNTEYLLYDFDVQVGDTLDIFGGIELYSYSFVEQKTYPHVITKIDTLDDGRLQITSDAIVIFEDGEVGTFEEKQQQIWIEGLGSINGIVHIGINPGIAGNPAIVMLCAYRDDECVYKTDSNDPYWIDYTQLGCVYNEGDFIEGAFPILSGLQRTVCNEYCGDTEDDNSANSTYKQTFDQIFFENDKPYILCNDYLLREEDNKIFLYSQSLHKDIVLYDFTLEVGDSLPAYIEHFDETIYPADTLVVTDVSYVTLLDGKEYKKWTFDNGMEYVEGIGMYGGRRNGNFVGLIQELVVPCHTGTHLVCVSKNGKLLYQMDDAEMDRLGAECLCDYDRGPLKDNAKNGKIGGRPTPTQWNQLELDLREMENGNTILRAETFSYTLENDSIVANGKTYYQLARQSTKDTATTKSFVGALHFGEDEDNRVYFFRDGVEYVLYDFTAEPGDTIEIFAGINNYPQDSTYTHVVTGKDTLENGACRMLLEVIFPDETATAENAEKVWLAGLGSVDGIVHNAATRATTARSSDTQTSVMLCAWRDDNCLYTTNHPDYNTLGCVYNIDEMTSVEDTHSSLPMTDCYKLLRNGQLLIIHKGKTYNVLGIAVE